MEKIKLHIGGTIAKEGWKILNVLPGPNVDIVGSCTDLSLFADDSVDEIYASHVIEHLNGKDAIQSLNEMRRVLKPGGLLKGSVPDINILFSMFLNHADDPSKQVSILQMIYGGHVDEFDVHHFGYNSQILQGFLAGCGFSRLEVVDKLNEFQDTSCYLFEGQAISLNFIAFK